MSHGVWTWEVGRKNAKKCHVFRFYAKTSMNGLHSKLTVEKEFELKN